MATTTKNINIYQALIAAQAAIKNVGKDGKNTFDKYAYRTIDGVMDAVHAAFVEAGVVAVPTVLEKDQVERTSRKGERMIHTTLTVKYTFFAPDGSSIEAIVQGEGMDRGDKSINKAMSGAYKYAMFQVLAIPTAELIDSETESPEIGKTQPKPQAKPAEPDTEETLERKSKLLGQILESAKAAGISMKQLTEINKGQSVSQMPLNRLEACADWLAGKAKEAAEKHETAEAEAEHQATPEKPADGDLTELEELHNKVVTLADKAGVSLEELEEQAGEPLAGMEVKALEAVIGYLEQMAGEKA